MKISKAKRTALAVIVFLLTLMLLPIVLLIVANATNSPILVTFVAVAMFAGAIYLIRHLKKGPQK